MSVNISFKLTCRCHCRRPLTCSLLLWQNARDGKKIIWARRQTHSIPSLTLDEQTKGLISLADDIGESVDMAYWFPCPPPVKQHFPVPNQNHENNWSGISMGKGPVLCCCFCCCFYFVVCITAARVCEIAFTLQGLRMCHISIFKNAWSPWWLVSPLHHSATSVFIQGLQYLMWFHSKLTM